MVRFHPTPCACIECVCLYEHCVTRPFFPHGSNWINAVGTLLPYCAFMKCSHVQSLRTLFSQCHAVLHGSNVMNKDGKLACYSLCICLHRAVIFIITEDCGYSITFPHALLHGANLINPGGIGYFPSMECVGLYNH